MFSIETNNQGKKKHKSSTISKPKIKITHVNKSQQLEAIEGEPKSCYIFDKGFNVQLIN